MQRLLAGRRFDRAVLHHGIYVPQGVIRAVLAAAGVPLATWNTGYRRNCFLFSHVDTYHHTMLDKPPAERDGQARGRRDTAKRHDGPRSSRERRPSRYWFPTT